MLDAVALSVEPLHSAARFSLFGANV